MKRLLSYEELIQWWGILDKHLYNSDIHKIKGEDYIKELFKDFTFDCEEIKEEQLKIDDE